MLQNLDNLLQQLKQAVNSRKDDRAYDASGEDSDSLFELLDRSMTPIDRVMFPFNNRQPNQEPQQCPGEQENRRQIRRPNMGLRKRRPNSKGNLLLSERFSKDYYAMNGSAPDLLGPRHTSKNSGISGLSFQGLLDSNDGTHSPHSIPIGSYRGVTYAVVTTPKASTESLNRVAGSSTKLPSGPDRELQGSAAQPRAMQQLSGNYCAVSPTAPARPQVSVAQARALLNANYRMPTNGPFPNPQAQRSSPPNGNAQFTHSPARNGQLLNPDYQPRNGGPVAIPTGERYPRLGDVSHLSPEELAQKAMGPDHQRKNYGPITKPNDRPQYPIQTLRRKGHLQVSRQGTGVYHTFIHAKDGSQQPRTRNQANIGRTIGTSAIKRSQGPRPISYPHDGMGSDEGVAKFKEN
jgi:hypothetical protein